MLATLHPPALATSSALRLATAATASLALHAALILAPAGAPAGSPLGRPGAGSPLAARIVALPAQAPAERALPAPPKLGLTAAEPVPTASARQAGPPSAPQAADAPALGLPEAPRYYLQSELDVRARMQGHVDPAYPATAPPDGGYVVLKLLIGEDGQVERAVVVVAEPEGYFEQAATEAFGAARFFPGRRGGVPVKSQTFIELKFHPLVPAEANAAAAGGKP